jgi:hypothetical protein
MVGGVIPETFRVQRALLNRIDNVETGEVAKEFQIEIPAYKRKEAEDLVKEYGHALFP